MFSQNIAINTTGVPAAAANMFEVTQTNTAANMVALYAINSGATAGTGYGFQALKTGAGTTNIAGYFSASGGTNNYAIIVPGTGGSVGIGTTAPLGQLDVVSASSADATAYGVYNNMTGTPSLSATRSYYAAYNNLLFRPTENGFNANGYGALNRVTTDGAYTFNVLRGAFNLAFSNSTAAAGQDNIQGSINQGYLNSTGAATNVYGVFNQGINNENTTGGTVTSLYGSWNQAYTNAGNTGTAFGAYNYALKNTIGNVTAAYGSYNRVRNSNATGTGAITTGYGVYSLVDKNASGNDYTTTYGFKADLNAGVTRWGLHVSNEQKNYFSGDVGIGTTAPGAKLEVAGQVKITGGSPALNSVLISDAVGLATWSTIAGAGGVTSSCGTLNYVPKMSTATAMVCSQIFDNGTNVGIGTAGPGAKLHIVGTSQNTLALESPAYPELTLRVGGVIQSYDAIATSAGGYFTTSGIGDRIFRAQVGNLLFGYGSTEFMRMTTTGYVGIGTTAPNQQLEITKNFRLPATTGATVGVIYSGANRYIHNYGTNNFFAGVNAGNFTMTGVQNTAVGTSALTSNTSGTSNTAIGRNTLYSNTAGVQNTAMGESALYTNSTGNSNTATGQEALYYNTTGGWNTATGQTALKANTTGNFNTAIGQAALFSNTGGGGNTASGVNALYFNTTGSNNTASGTNALYSNTTGNSNTAHGKQALYLNTWGFNNTATGEFALYSNTTGSYNTGTGYTALNKNTGSSNTAHGAQALYNTTTGNNNTAIGRGALYNNTTGNSNTAIGAYALQSNTGGGSNIAIGQNALNGSTTGVQNTVVGAYAGTAITTGSNNTAIGINAQVPVGTNSNQVRIGDAFTGYAGVQVAWTITSDKRFKSDIQNSNLGLDFITKLRPVFYVRINDAAKKTEYGFIAQELEETLNACGASDNGIVSKDDQGMYGVRYNDLLPPMVKALQELNAKNEAQQKTIELLLKRIEAFENSKNTPK